MNYEPEVPRRGSRNRALERSLSYSEAIGNGSGRSSIEIPTIGNNEVYLNEELKKQYRISQTYVEGKEIAFPNVVTNVDTTNFLRVPIDESSQESSHFSSEDEHTDNGLIMTIDVEDTTKSSDVTKNISDDTTVPIASSSIETNTNDIYDTIETFGGTDSLYERKEATFGYSTPYSRRKRATHR